MTVNSSCNLLPAGVHVGCAFVEKQGGITCIFPESNVPIVNDLVPKDLRPWDRLPPRHDAEQVQVLESKIFQFTPKTRTDAQKFEIGTLTMYPDGLVRGGCQLVACGVAPRGQSERQARAREQHWFR